MLSAEFHRWLIVRLKARLTNGSNRTGDNGTRSSLPQS